MLLRPYYIKATRLLVALRSSLLTQSLVNVCEKVNTNRREKNRDSNKLYTYDTFFLSRKSREISCCEETFSFSVLYAKRRSRALETH